MKISVVIPLYNKKESILRALNSVFLQTVQPEEVIVVNDGSTDGSEKLVTNLKHPLVKLISQQNEGVSSARNKGIAEAGQEWIAFLDSDDEWLPTYLQTIVMLSEKFPQISVLATSYYLQDFQGKRKAASLRNLNILNEFGIIDNYFEIAANSDPPIWTSAVVVRKSKLQEIGGFPLNVKSGEDLLTWARLAVIEQIAFANFPLAVFIQDSTYTFFEKPSRMPDYPDLVGNGLISLANENPGVMSIYDYVAHWHKMRASVNLRLGMKKAAGHDILKSLSFRPFYWKLYGYLLLIALPTSLVNTLFRRFGYR